MNGLAPWLLVFIGGGLGAASRHGVNLVAMRAIGINFPWGTLIVNAAGSVLMGLIAGWLAFRAGANWTQHARLFLTTGFLGGFTTFSAFSLDSALLWERGEPGLAAAYILANVILSIGGLLLGLWIVRSLS
ncbi:CrcB protein [Bauldia litoralis]|uniref:Fluoride-specific ion channel FluC n=1 Tax=Bauldia litoralis TaxID=665467 RepID=A0A1G6B7T4_9HYPH|nr:fluoride efflux transporter CrcB [Bauldia litoralis]SDB16666.1 CrcB protein [Bauldia litoralis]